MPELNLLPSVSTPIEVALDLNANRLLDADSDIIRRVKDPDRCPIPLLPFLAWERGVDLWFDSWPDWKKRRITKHIYQLKGSKGTIPGHSGYLFYVDAEIVQSIIPPQGVTARAQSADRLEAYRNRFAELRVYRFWDRGNRPGTAAKRTERPSSATVGRLVARQNVAQLYYGRRAVIRDHGVETVIRSQDQLRADGAADFVIPTTMYAIPAGARARELLVGRAAVGSGVAHAKQKGRLLVMGADGNVAGGGYIPPGAEGVRVLNLAPEYVEERHDGVSYEGVASSWGHYRAGRIIARPTRANRFIYSRWRIYDAARAGSEAYRAVGSVVGKVVPSLRPFYGLLRIDARFRWTGRHAVVGRMATGKAPAQTASNRINEVGLALWRSKALRDTVRFTTKTYRPRSVGDLSFDVETSWGGMVPIVPLTRTLPK